mmetsp:Transcript_49750/g.160006  ORF Transcript_49750/g.160006 Transcript_49750/m.160006 type:complete len:209 (-) Transcript_49750:2463-3089(-)
MLALRSQAVAMPPVAQSHQNLHRLLAPRHPPQEELRLGMHNTVSESALWVLALQEMVLLISSATVAMSHFVKVRAGSVDMPTPLLLVHNTMWTLVSRSSTTATTLCCRVFSMNWGLRACCPTCLYRLEQEASVMAGTTNGRLALSSRLGDLSLCPARGAAFSKSSALKHLPEQPWPRTVMRDWARSHLANGSMRRVSLIGFVMNTSFP